MARSATAGFLRGRLVVVVWTPREEARHIISMRHCHAKEEKKWHERMG
ncbi:BrnT family toxin [Afipia carboxidovorans]